MVEHVTSLEPRRAGDGLGDNTGGPHRPDGLQLSIGVVELCVAGYLLIRAFLLGGGLVLADQVRLRPLGEFFFLWFGANGVGLMFAGIFLLRGRWLPQLLIPAGGVIAVVLSGLLL